MYRIGNKHEVIVGALGADFIDGLEAELDARPRGVLKHYTEQTIRIFAISSSFC